MLIRYMSILFVFLFACTTQTTQNFSLEQQPNPTDGDAMTMSEINPGLPSVGVKLNGWSANGQLIAPSVLGGSGSGEVSLQANFDDPGNYTIEFSVQTPGNFSFNRVQQSVEALITWSVAGNSLSRRVTIANGTSVSGVGQGVKIRIFDASEFQAGIDPPGSVFTYDVAVQVSRGSRAANGAPPTYVPISSIDQNNSSTAGLAVAQVDVPRDAGVNSVRVVGYRVSGANRFALLQGDVIISQAAPISSSNYDYTDQSGSFVPLIPGVTRIDVIAARTYVAPSEYHVTVILGVDG